MIDTTRTTHPSAPELVTRRAHDAAVVRIDGPTADLPRLLGEAFELTASAIHASGARIDGPPFARYLAIDPVVRAEVGFPFTGDLTPTDRVYRTTLPGGSAVKALHVGPYEELGATWESIKTWIGAQGFTTRATPWESYLTDPDVVPPVTEVIFPID